MDESARDAKALAAASGVRIEQQASSKWNSGSNEKNSRPGLSPAAISGEETREDIRVKPPGGARTTIGIGAETQRDHYNTGIRCTP
jgi:hypothetical protein